MNIVLWICGITLSIAGALAMIRLAKGPSILERVIATDVLLLIVSAALCVDMTINKHTDNLIFVLLACLVGFVGSVTVSRFVTDRRNA
ncbi:MULTISPECIES: monovalent cation/H+ antiporter complex subunit F [Micrococcaceae]|jgi:multicomponent Na+:H+ antiporter subunit F|uniref:monovalent cation/H+ antiporter complex subunit F n=1 Tax=Micrococcaceae TaxID=1268 RepID=UPI0008DE834A|nr:MULTISPECIES: monovalent cation/H+ antiporter complex subunit F [Micrococcaceae]MDQ0095239.1 multicomponent Na+:H+ antiporter subunit F [Paeniglutamicibacter psychrophenolicus]OIH86481.1 cation:proton antiporter [Arthrobacter sp. UCD-GKA]